VFDTEGNGVESFFAFSCLLKEHRNPNHSATGMFC
jgi:hypothetical protein